MKKKEVKKEIFKLDFGCGPNVREGFEGVDIRDFGQSYILDLMARGESRTRRGAVDLVNPTGAWKPWPWKDNSVEEAHASHFIEHLTPEERIHFVNELYRVLKPGGKCQTITPHWASMRAYGDLTHKWPPVSEFWFYYLSKDWRAQNAPHNDGYMCDFDVTWGYALHPLLVSRNAEFQQEALNFKKEAAQDTIATFVKK